MYPYSFMKLARRWSNTQMGLFVIVVWNNTVDYRPSSGSHLRVLNRYIFIILFVLLLFIIVFLCWNSTYYNTTVVVHCIHMYTLSDKTIDRPSTLRGLVLLFYNILYFLLRWAKIVKLKKKITTNWNTKYMTYFLVYVYVTRTYRMNQSDCFIIWGNWMKYRDNNSSIIVILQ